MVEQLRGQFEKLVDSLYSKKRPSPYLHKVPTRNTKVKGMKIIPLLLYPHHNNLA
jgi:hypothetical protein